MPTDTERIDFLQKLLDQKRYTGRAILRFSTTGRGWRLHETSNPKGKTSVRETMDIFMEEYDRRRR